MAISTKLDPKPKWVKRCADVAAAFIMSIDAYTDDARAVKFSRRKDASKV